jgi:hypothetical protein
MAAVLPGVLIVYVWIAKGACHHLLVLTVLQPASTEPLACCAARVAIAIMPSTLRLTSSGSYSREVLGRAVTSSLLEDDVSSLDIAKFDQLFANCVEDFAHHRRVGRRGCQEADPRNFRPFGSFRHANQIRLMTKKRSGRFGH